MYSLNVLLKNISQNISKPSNLESIKFLLYIPETTNIPCLISRIVLNFNYPNQINTLWAPKYLFNQLIRNPVI